MSDYPPRVDSLRAQLQVALDDSDFSIEEVWVSTKTSAYTDGYTSRRWWRITIQTGRNMLPTVVDIPDKLVIESLKTSVAHVIKSAARVIVKR